MPISFKVHLLIVKKLNLLKLRVIQKILRVLDKILCANFVAGLQLLAT